MELLDLSGSSDWLILLGSSWIFLDSSWILLGSWILIPAEILGSTGRLIADILFLILDPDFLKSGSTQDLVNSS